MPGARGGLSRVTVIPSPTTWWRTLCTLRGAPWLPPLPYPGYFSGQCCKLGSPAIVPVGHKELGRGLLPSRPSWSQGTSLMKATPGNFRAVGEITTALRVTVEA